MERDRVRQGCFLLGAILEVIQHLLRFSVAPRLDPQIASWIKTSALIIALVGALLILLAVVGGLFGDIGR